MFGLDLFKKMKGMDLDTLAELLSAAIGGPVNIEQTETQGGVPGSSTVKISGTAKDGRRIEGVLTVIPSPAVAA